MKSKLNTAIDIAYELIKQEWLNGGKHNMNLAVALDQLEPYYEHPYRTYTEERKTYWKEQISFHEYDEELTEQQIERIADRMLDWDDGEALLTENFMDAIDSARMDVMRDESEEDDDELV